MLNFDPSLLIMGASGGILYSIRSIPVKLYNRVRQRFVYTVRIYQYDDLFDCVETWLCDHHTSNYRDVEASLGEKGYQESNANQPSKPISYKQEENDFIINHQGKRLVISKTKEKVDKATSVKDLYFRKYMITGLDAKLPIQDLLYECVEYSRKKEARDVIRVYSNSGYGDWQYSVKVRTKPLDKVILNPELKTLLISDINTFIASEEWYINASIPYKRGYLFHGPPGTGKTTLGLAVANYTQKNVYCLNLNSIDDDSRLNYAFGSIQENAILLIEDIDKIFSGRENVREDSKVSFSTFLNCLDGAFAKHGILTIITTNHPEKLDPALLRTGRIDIKAEIPRPSASEIEQYLTVFYERPVKLPAYHQGLTMSDVQETCIKNRNNSEEAVRILSSLK